jgi:hopene-associated glycosyltransferase HpnB
MRSGEIKILSIFVAGVLPLAIQVYLACFRGGFWRFRERLVTGAPARPGASITAVIPARDEAAFIGRAVRSLRAQEFDGNMRIIVADDQSSDGTAEAARADVVLRVDPRPVGWKGKLWAVASGVRSETEAPDFFLLTDADIEYASSDAVRSLVAKAESGFDLVSVMVKLRVETTAEKFLIPAFVFFFFKLYPPAWVSAGKTAAAAGGCMLIRREMLERIGGIESIRDALIDDCALARRVNSAGGRVWLGTSRLAIHSMRGYGQARDVREMIARAAFAQLNHSTALLFGTVLGMLAIYVMPVLDLFSGDPVVISLGTCAWVLSAAIFMPAVREYGVSRWMAFCLPGIALFYMTATVESALRYWSGRGGMWKGRVQDARE